MAFMIDDYSRRCSRFFRSVWSYADISSQAFNALCGFPEEYESSFWRLLSGNQGAIWTPEIAEKLTQASLPWIGTSPSEVCKYLRGEPSEASSRLREMELSYYWWPRKSTADQLRKKLQQYEPGATLVTGIQRFLPVSLMTKEVYTQYYRNLTMSWGDFGRRARTVLFDFGRVRTQQFYEKGGYGASRTRLCVFMSDFQRALEMKGLVSGLDPSDLHDCLVLLLEEAIRGMGLELIFINDNLLPARVAEHYSRFEGVVLADNRFVTKIHRNSLKRSWIERAAGADHAVCIDEEVSMATELLRYRVQDATEKYLSNVTDRLLS